MVIKYFDAVCPWNSGAWPVTGIFLPDEDSIEGGIVLAVLIYGENDSAIVFRSK
jgi:hypothetical protein